MLELYWGCLMFGLLFAVVTVLLGDVMSHALDGLLDFLSVDFLQPMVIAGAVTLFGGAGILLTRYSGWAVWIILTLAVGVAVIGGAIIYFFYVKPMNNSENSVGYSIYDLKGSLGEAIISIPEDGYGEVVIKVGAGVSNHIAASFDGQLIPAGKKIVVVEVKERTLLVSPFDP
ncbi:protease [Paenibacillus sp. J2TS4]|uniref:protease n=1 Tax=Paenibacillus sp. J2TS4 TaxID=2807194 RepID=UPI001B03B7C4|nr:protease [Paenibacillus sp. J2TS4]GIP34047.1 hypothetical protein J2TS4_32570 [Paenibacillus sp. J2TS4]